MKVCSKIILKNSRSILFLLLCCFGKVTVNILSFSNNKEQRRIWDNLSQSQSRSTNTKLMKVPNCRHIKEFKTRLFYTMVLKTVNCTNVSDWYQTATNSSYGSSFPSKKANNKRSLSEINNSQYKILQYNNCKRLLEEYLLVFTL